MNKFITVTQSESGLPALLNADWIVSATPIIKGGCYITLGVTDGIDGGQFDAVTFTVEESFKKIGELLS